MPNINAALGLAQLEQLPGFLENKRLTAEKYKNFFSMTNFKFFSEPEHAISNYWLNAVLMDSRKERDEFLKYSNENGVMSRPAWQLMNKLEMFSSCITGEIENTNFIASRLVNLPSSVIS
jgi:perosamine synthetase